LSLEANPTSSFAVGILTNVFPSLLFINPLGGQTGEGDGVNVAFALVRDITDAAPAAGMHMDSAITSAINFLITIPLKLTNAKEDADS